MAVLFAAHANAAETSGIQANNGEPPKIQAALILLASAGQTEDTPQPEEAESRREYSGNFAVPKPKKAKSARIKQPVVRSVKQQKRIPDAAPPSLSSAAPYLAPKASGDVDEKKKLKPSDKLSLTLSMTLSDPAIVSTRPDIPTGTNDTPQGEPVAKDKRLNELYAQIAETEKMIKEQQIQLDMLNRPSSTGLAGSSVASSGAIAQSSVADNVPANTDKRQIRPQMAGLDVLPPSKVQNSQFGSLETSWVQLAIGLIVLLLTAPGFVWYRKLKTAQQGKRGKLEVLSDAQADDEAIIKAPVPVVEQSIKTPAYTEKKMQSILPPEYEMLEEADIYLRFGHDKLAEEALREAIKINPGNPQAYLTLSRIYFSREDRAAFLALAEQLKSLNDENIWNKIAEMGRNLDPGNSLYG